MNFHIIYYSQYGFIKFHFKVNIETSCLTRFLSKLNQLEPLLPFTITQNLTTLPAFGGGEQTSKNKVKTRFKESFN